MDRKELAEQNIRDIVNRMENTEEAQVLVTEVFVYCSQLVKELHETPRRRQMTILEVHEVLDVLGAEFFERRYGGTDDSSLPSV